MGRKKGDAAKRGAKMKVVRGNAVGKKK